MTWLWWAVSALGGIGIVGLIALAIFAPPMALAIWKLISSGFLWFFRTRIGFGVVVGVAVWYGTSWYQRHVDVREFEAEKASFKAAQAQRDADIRKDAESFVRKQIADEYMAQMESDDEVSKFKATLDPGRKCPIGDDAPILRRWIEGGKLVGPDHNGMRKAPGKKDVPADQRKR